MQEAKQTIFCYRQHLCTRILVLICRSCVIRWRHHGNSLAYANVVFSTVHVRAVLIFF